MAATQYFVVMCDYGKRGREAIVDPEITRRDMISRIASGEYSNVLFVHEIRDPGDNEGLIAADITDEVKSEALSMIVTEPEDIDRQAQAWDRKRDLMESV